MGPATLDEASGSHRASLRLMLGTPGWGAGTFAGVRAKIHRDDGMLRSDDYLINVEEPRCVLTHKHLPMELEYLRRATGERVRLPVAGHAACGLTISAGPLTIPSDAASGLIQDRLSSVDE